MTDTPRRWRTVSKAFGAWTWRDELKWKLDTFKHYLKKIFNGDNDNDG